jgi:hypothetical protein
LKGAGITGAESYDLIYQAWQKWLSQAKNTAEIDEAKKNSWKWVLLARLQGNN